MAGWHEQRQAKITEQNFITSIQKHIFRLEITMDQMLIVRVVESRSYLLDIWNNSIQWKTRTGGMALA